MPTGWAATWCGCPCGTGRQVGMSQRCLLPQPGPPGCSSFPWCASAQQSWLGAAPAPGGGLGAAVLLMPLSSQPAKERPWDKPSSRKPSLGSPKAPLQPGSRAPRHPGRGPGEDPCRLPHSGCQPLPAAGRGGTLTPCSHHWWRRSSLRPASSPNRTYLWFCLSAACFWMPQTLGMVKVTQSPWKT